MMFIILYELYDITIETKIASKDDMQNIGNTCFLTEQEAEAFLDNIETCIKKRRYANNNTARWVDVFGHIDGKPLYKCSECGYISVGSTPNSCDRCHSSMNYHI